MKHLFILILLSSCKLLKIQPFSPQKTPELSTTALKENKLSRSSKLNLNGAFGPEDILISPDGAFVYTGVHDGQFRNGKLLKISKDGESEVIYESPHWIVGLEWSISGDIIALVLNKGVVSINPNTRESISLVDKIEGQQIKIPNDVAVGASGTIYFTVTSFVDEFSMDNAMKIVLEQRIKGGVFSLDPSSGVLTRLGVSGVFLNGIEVSRDESYLLVVETGKYRVYKHWLSGEKTGETEVLADNLEGIPNGISKAKDGNYWVGFSSIRNPDLDLLHSYPFLKSLVYNLPEFLKPKLSPFGIALKMSEEGEILARFYDKDGGTVSEATSVVEHDNILYFGGDRSGYIPFIHLDSL